MTTTTAEPHTVEIGSRDNGVDLVVVDAPDGRTIDVLPVGRADALDEGMGLRLDRALAAQLATSLFELLTDR